MKKIPEFVFKYLWDVPRENISLDKYANFIIERVLEYGDSESINWLNKTYKKEKIIEVLKKSKKISTKTGIFYALYYDIPKGELLCIRKPFTQKQERF